MTRHAAVKGASPLAASAVSSATDCAAVLLLAVLLAVVHGASRPLCSV
jgi:hypothetical protein